MKKTTLFLGGLVALSLASCSNNETVSAKADAPKADMATAKTDMSTVRADIQAVENEWAAALNKKDVPALMALYADDAKSMQDGGPTLTGKAAIQEYQEKEFAAPPKYASISFQTQEVYGSEEEVTEVGTSSMKDADGKEVGTGKYMAVYVKKDGKYKCIREIYNNDRQ